MNPAITLDRVVIAGFRAFLAEQELNLHQGSTPKSIAILAPNAKGKSSIVDALEFYFSGEGTLARFGERASGTHVGREPLIHSRAAKDGSESYVTLTFRGAPAGFPEKRVVGRAASPRPAQAEHILGVTPVAFIIRGHDLRAFVEQRTPEDRYSEVSNWFGLSPLVAIQRNLRNLRRAVKKQLDDEPAAKERSLDIGTITGRAVTVWDEAQALSWLNTGQLAPLDPTLQLDGLSGRDPAYGILTKRKLEEDQSVGLRALTKASDAIRSLVGLPSSPGGARLPGAFDAFDDAFAALTPATEALVRERARSQQAVFREVWDAAQALFRSQTSLEACPVCGTPLAATPHGSQEGLREHLHTELTGLAGYRRAQDALKETGATCKLAAQQLHSALTSTETVLRAAGYELAAKLASEHRAALAIWEVGAPPPNSTACRASLLSALELLDRAEADIRASQGNRTYATALAKVDDVIALKTRLEQFQRRSREVQATLHELGRIATFVDGEIRAHVLSIVDHLRETTNRYYERIQSAEGKVPQICLQLAGEKDSNQQVLHLAFDFDDTRMGVPPHAYLSDAQIHTLALSLRLAAVTLLNREFPVVVLDDVVTSYDADHRSSIAALIAEDLQEIQVVIVTHDQRFFAYLKDRVSSDRWLFKRIVGLDRARGPRFEDHRVTDEMIRAKWELGESAANEIRQAEEEWLLQRCREFGVEIRIRDLSRPYSYERSELAEALQRFLKKTGVKPPEIPGVKSSFLVSLQRGEVENFGSHFQDAPDAITSIGDEKARWSEFQQFCDLFHCGCGSTRFKRPQHGMDRATCAKCETPFAFLQLRPAAGDTGGR